MKKLLGSALLSVGLLAGTAQAGLITDTVEQEKFIDWGDEYSYSHNLNDEGFVLGSALSGTLEIQVADDKKGLDEWFFGESILFIVEEFDFDTGGMSLFGSAFSSALEVEVLASINADGYLGVTVKSITGDFWLGDSILSVNTVSVLSPSILGLMVIGLAGLGLSRRRNRAELA
ncbi:hypothetical protein [Marinimicrobium locisalis]|uniref:hypothetical protein n=1 Tax=Marinimicrobium locisalis TaxID=546022 RepID=UPI0032214ABC